MIGCKEYFLHLNQFFCFVLLFSFSFLPSQDLSGDWKTAANNGGFYAELHLVHNGNGSYSGHSYDEQGGGYCSYRLIGNFNSKRNLFEAKNTSVIQRSPQHRASNYRLRYYKVGDFEYLRGTVQVISEFSIGFPGQMPQMESVPIQVEYFRVIKDPIVEYSKDKKDDEIYAKQKDSISILSPLPIPDPKELNKENQEILDNNQDLANNLPIPEIIPQKKPEPEIVDIPVVLVEKPKENTPMDDNKILEEIVEEKPFFNKEELEVFKETRTERVIKTYNSNNSKIIQLKIRDYDEEDGDVISIFLNDELVANNLEIKKKEIVLKVKINPNQENKFTFVANNQGKIPPNTCEVSFKVRGKTYYDKIFTDDKTNSVVIFKP